MKKTILLILAISVLTIGSGLFAGNSMNDSRDLRLTVPFTPDDIYMPRIEYYLSDNLAVGLTTEIHRDVTESPAGVQQIDSDIMVCPNVRLNFCGMGKVQPWGSGFIEYDHHRETQKNGTEQKRTLTTFGIGTEFGVDYNINENIGIGGSFIGAEWMRTGETFESDGSSQDGDTDSGFWLGGGYRMNIFYNF